MQKSLTLFSMGIMILIDNIDTTAVNLAIPYIAKDLLLMNNNSLAWISNGYLISATAIMVVAGYLADKYGNRRIFCIGVIIFMLASIGIVYSDKITEIILLRIVQGIGFALTYPVTVVIIRNAFPVGQKGQAMGWVAGLTGFSVAIGPNIGGFVLNYFSWRDLFLLNVPLCLITLFFTLLIVNEDRKDITSIPIDYLGITTLSVSLFSIMTCLNNLEYLLNNPLVLFITVTIGISSLVVFILVELSKKHPLLEIRFFKKNKVFLYTTTIRTLSQYIVVSVFFFFPLLLQNIKLFDANFTGLLFLPMTLSMGIMSIPAGKIIDTVGINRTLLISIILMLIASIMMLFIDNKSSPEYISFSLFILGISFGLHFPSMSTGALLGVSSSKINTATGLYYTIIGIGGAIGVSISSYLASFVSNLSTGSYIKNVDLILTNDDFKILKSVASAAQPSNLLDQITNISENLREATFNAFFNSYQCIITIYVFLCFLILILYMAIRKDIVNLELAINNTE